MIVTHKIEMDLARKGAMPRIDVVQGDTNTRIAEITLLSDGTPWEVPESAAVKVRYGKPDGTGSSYTVLEDGTQAWSISGSTVTVHLAPQMLTVDGCVFMQIELTQEDSCIATFMIGIVVERNPAISVDEFARDGRIGLVPVPIEADDGKILRVVDGVAAWSDAEMVSGTSADAVLCTEQTLTEEQKAQARENIGAPAETELQGTVNDALAQARESGEFDGADGYTPVRGVDYWTEADKAEIKAYVDEAILGGAW